MPMNHGLSQIVAGLLSALRGREEPDVEAVGSHLTAAIENGDQTAFTDGCALLVVALMAFLRRGDQVGFPLQEVLDGVFARLMSPELPSKASPRRGVGSSVRGDSRSPLVHAQCIGEEAAEVGFDWPDPQSVMDKVAEELAEVRDAKTRRQREEELGDLLFACVNLARHLDVDAERALLAGVGRFGERFQWAVAAAGSDGRSFEECSPAEMDEYWERAKVALARGGGEAGSSEGG